MVQIFVATIRKLFQFIRIKNDIVIGITFFYWCGWNLVSDARILYWLDAGFRTVQLFPGILCDGILL